MNADDIRGLFFLDTNIFVYSFDDRAPEKRRLARQWIGDALRTQRGIVSTQVVQEFLSVATQKFASPLAISDAREYLRSVLQPLCHHYPSIAFYDRALCVKENVGCAWFDALIIAAAQEAACSVLLSEDLQTGRQIDKLRILDPFAAGPKPGASG